MTTVSLWSRNAVICGIGTGKSYYGRGHVAVQRLPTDPLFYADLTLNNIVAGSRYRVTRHSNGDELATGVAAGSGLVDITLSGIPCFSNPMQVDITVRNASGSPAYKVFDTSAFMVKAGSSAYILQQED
jgi:hypothetical protein